MKRFTYLYLAIAIFNIKTYAQEKFADVHNISTNFKFIEIVRMRSGTDLLEGLNKVVEERKIKNAVILAGIGSVTDYHYHVVSDTNLPPGEEYPKASVPMDLTSVQGYILNGRVQT